MLQEGAENVWQMRTAGPPETERPATTPPEGPSVAAGKDVFLPVAGASPPPALHSIISSSKLPLASSSTSCLTCILRLDFTSGCEHTIACATGIPTLVLQKKKVDERAASP